MIEKIKAVGHGLGILVKCALMGIWFCWAFGVTTEALFAAAAILIMLMFTPKRPW